MDGLNISRILAGLRNPELYLKQVKNGAVNDGQNAFNSAFSQARPNNFVQPNPLNALILNNQLQMNQLASMDRSVYIKNLLDKNQFWN